MLTQTTETAIKALLFIAVEKEKQPISISVIAKKLKCSPTYLSKTMGHLAKAGIIAVQHGSKGGMSIQRPYDQITLLEVVQACQGMFLPDFCDTPEEHNIHICTFHKAMHEVREATLKTLGKWRLANLVANPHGNIVGKTHPVCKMRFGDSRVVARVGAS
ncbi:MAG: Rrf2 family transcriptional regulator [Spirochaetia bacterium]|nr:Rrf2 family transcriptional regulator [Spirochaetia bacterium]